jgi:mannose-6-phosphate isomerase-like protein (cupin superfamily)
MLKGLKQSKIIQKPWGYEEIWADCKNYLGKILVIEPNKRLSRQYHVLKDETIRVLSGTLILEIGPSPVTETKTLLPGEIFHVIPGTVHRFCAGDEKVELLEVSTAHPDDVVRLEDDYKR